MDLTKIIIDTPYDNRGCYNCWYHILLPKDKCIMCELHNTDVSIWDWCEGWENEERYRIHT